jgi:hypothetical protein
MLTKVPDSMLENPGGGGSGGGVALADPVAFRSTLVGTQSLPAFTFTKVPFDTTDLNLGDYFDTTDGTFTPAAGIYRLSATVSVSGAGVSDGDTFRVSIYKNGIADKTELYIAAAASKQFSLTVDGLFEANGFDTFEVYVFFGSFIATTDVLNDAAYTSFQGIAVALDAGGGVGSKVCFKATLDGTDAVVPANTTTILPFNTEEINAGEFFDTGTYSFTPPAGTYRLSVRGLQLNTTADNEILRVSICKNDSPVASQIYHGIASGSSIPFSLSTVVEANGEDYFDARYFSFTLAGTKTIEGDPLYTVFEGEQI